MIGLAACGKGDKAAPPGTNVGAPTAPNSAAPKSPAAAKPLQHPGNGSSLFTGASDKAFVLSLELGQGAIVSGANIDAVDRAGHRVSFKVTKITDSNDASVPRLESGSRGAVELELLTGSTGALDPDLYYFVDPGAPFPVEASKREQAEIDRRRDAKGKITCSLDGAQWPVTLSSPSYAKRGIRAMNITGRFVQLVFGGSAPDTRTITLWARDWEPTTGVVEMKRIEAMMTGSPDGDRHHSVLLGYKAISEYADASVTWKVTKWEPTSATAAFMDATIDAKLTGVLKTSRTAASVHCTLEHVAFNVYETDH